MGYARDFSLRVTRMAELISPIAEKSPERLALADEFGNTKWGEFHERVNRLINALRKAGLKTGDTFAVLSGNRREYVEAFAAAAHGGWLLVPINWHLVAKEICYILENSQSKALFIDSRFDNLGKETISHPDAPHISTVIVFDNSQENLLAGRPDVLSYEEFLSAASLEEPDEQSLGGPMFYTSGTTGHPKGVKSALSQTGAPVETLKMIGDGLSGMLSIQPGGRTLLVGPIYHSAQWAFSFLPLLAGSSIIMRHKFDGAETLNLIDKYEITNIHLVPTQFTRMLRLDKKEKKSFAGKSLDIVWHGAAPCPPKIKRQMIDWWGPVICEYYGSTEGSIVSTVNSEEWLTRPGTLGKPTPIMEIVVVKDDGSKAENGESGQIYVRNLMGSDFEYHNDPEKTEKAHLEPGLFTFGDIGYLDSDGYLFMSDRKIDMIISGGVNIYPAEIEAVLIDHPSVIDAAVFGIPNEEFGEEVKAAIELNEEIEGDEKLMDEIIAYCRENLAGFKVPKSIDFEKNLPRHPTGKLLKRILRDKYWNEEDRKI
ncbi:MAG: AMP-dependent synthetase [Gammaproteobacteria bacterium]|nr:AMP-dependent synthetase [Gammaproteobacteria bacterium]